MCNWVKFFLVISLFLGVLSPASVKPAAAQTPPPPEPFKYEFCPPGELCEGENGERFVMPNEVTDNTVAAIGDTDDYGYSLTTIPFTWFEASSGTKTTINDTWDRTDAISLPFNFPFYENTYTKFFISGLGFATFDEDNYNDYGNDIPDESKPNNLISPLSQYFYYSSGAVFYKSLGTHFVIQWNNLKDNQGGVYTFQAVLFSDGSINFSYKTLPDPSQGWYCSTSGIENSTGTDGLPFWQWCDQPSISNNSSVRFTRPSPTARVGVNPIFLGEFSHSLDNDEFFFTLTNTGNLGADTYDMEVTTAPLGLGWTAILHDAIGGTPLTDTDSDGKVDSGSLAQGANREIMVRVTAPAGLSVGARNTTIVEVTSSRNPSKTKSVTIDSTVPAPFAQVYKDQTINTLSSDLNWSTYQMEVKLVEESWNAYEPAIAETLNNDLIQVWADYEWTDNGNGRILRYAIINKYGEVVKPVTDLSAVHPDTDYQTYDGEPAMAVAGDGKIGVIWSRTIYAPDNTYNENIWFATINPSGNIAYGPVNLTNNPVYGSWNTGNRIELSDPDISASSGHFMLTWMQGGDNQDIYYLIKQTNAVTVVPITQMTESVYNTSYFYEPILIGLTDNRFMLTYTNQYRGNQGYYYSKSYYRVFNSNGSTLVGPNDLNFYPRTGIQLSGGNILLARRWNEGIKYQLRSGTKFGLVYESDELIHPSGDAGWDTISITKDASNRGIITWSDENLRYLYYAYVQGNNGSLLSGPVIYKRGQFNLSYNGSSTTTNSLPSGVDLSASFDADIIGGVPDGLVNLGVSYKNQGGETASNPVLKITLPVGLSYISDSAGIAPSVAANVLSWNLPAIAFLESGNFRINLKVDSALVAPKFLDVSLTITSTAKDNNEADNTDASQVLIGFPTFLPMIIR